MYTYRAHNTLLKTKYIFFKLVKIGLIQTFINIAFGKIILEIEVQINLFLSKNIKGRKQIKHKFFRQSMFLSEKANCFETP